MAYGSQPTEYRWEGGFSFSFLFYLHAISGHDVYNEKTRIKHMMCVSLLSRATPLDHSPATCVLRVAISDALPWHWALSQPEVALGFESCFAQQPMPLWARQGRNREETHGGSQCQGFIHAFDFWKWD